MGLTVLGKSPSNVTPNVSLHTGLTKVIGHAMSHSNVGKMEKMPRAKYDDD